MGLKTGLAALAEKEGKFIRLDKKDGHPFSFAQVMRRGRGRFCLLYPDGKVGFMTKVGHFQSAVWFIEFSPRGFIPSAVQRMALEGTLPKEFVMFDGGYEMSEKPPGFLPPPALHATDEERFKNPEGLLEKVVASYLKSQPAPG